MATAPQRGANPHSRRSSGQGGEAGGLTRICNETKALEGYKEELKPVFKSTPTQFQTIIYANIDEDTVGDGVKDGVKELTDIQGVVLAELQTDSSITTIELAQKLNVKFRTLQRYISQLQDRGYLTRKGGRKDGKWLLTELGSATLERLKK